MASHQIFISFVEQDSALAASLAAPLEAAGYGAWMYTRDELPGISFLKQIETAIGAASVFLLIASQTTLEEGKAYITSEVVCARGKALHFLPVLVDISFEDLKAQQEEWALAIGPAPAIRVPKTGIAEAVPKILRSLEAMQIKKSQTAAAPQPAKENPVRKPAAGKNIVLLYKRKARPDEDILHFLDQRLTSLGHSVFYDRHLKTGVEWPDVIKEKLLEADLVAPIVSIQSFGSEMIEEEINVAQDCMRQRGKPNLFQIRVQYDGEVNNSLGSALKRIHYFLWKSPEDNERLVEEMLASLEREVEVESPVRRTAGGAIPASAKAYIARPTDLKFEGAISRGDSIVLVNGPRQMGKTSLLVRGLELARKAGRRVLLTDFQKLNGEDFQTAEKFFRALAELIIEREDLDIELDSIWKKSLAPSPNFERFLRRTILKDPTQNVVWGMDEVDRLFVCPFGSDVFGLFRSWYNERSLDPEGPWGRLTIAIVYATEANLFIKDPNQSPFNVGTKLTLDDFTLAETSAFNRLYNEPISTETEMRDFYAMLGGHPFLTHQGLEQLSRHRVGFADFIQDCGTDQGPYSDHLRRILFLIGQQESLLESILAVLRGETQVGFENFFRLRTSGVLAGNSANSVRFRCKLYEDYLRRHLVDQAVGATQ